MEERDRQRSPGDRDAREPRDQDERRVPSISLPKGGGALRSIDEKFSVNAANGTSDLTVALPFSKTRSGLDGAVSLRYTSGGGNGVFGLGWALTLPSIQRSTERHLPRYEDSADSDLFVLAGAENLVPSHLRDDLGVWNPDEVSAGIVHVLRYRPRIEGLFTRIEKIKVAGEGGFFWKTTTRDNVVTIFGRTNAARLSDPADHARTFRWLPQWAYDDQGNSVEFIYKEEDLAKVPDVIEEKNRRAGIQPFANVYLKRIRYGNRVPYFADAPYTPTAPGDLGYCFDAVLDYGDHDDLAPAVTASRAWPCRFDPFSDCRAGFEIRTYRLCRRVLFFHTFAELGAAETLVRSIDLQYRSFDFGASPYVSREADLVTNVHSVHYRKSGALYRRKELPPLTLRYHEPQWNKSVSSITTGELLDSPSGQDAPFQWLDLFGEGAPGMLTEQGGAWYFKANEGAGRFAAALPIAPKPSVTGIASSMMQFQDLDADGRKQVVSAVAGLRGYFELDDDNEWLPFRAFEQSTTTRADDRNARLLDLDGDGKADLLIAEETVFRWYPSLGTRGFDAARFAAKEMDEERGPALVFADGTESIFIADMNGDGLADLVRVRNGEVCYWPNLGYGRFGARISMRGAPLFDHPERFAPARVQLADVTGTGAADLIYLGRDGLVAWINLAGNAWSEPETIDPFPHTSPQTRVSVFDLLGNGTAAIVWQSDLPADAGAPIRYIDLMGGRKPYILSSVHNNLGKEVSIEYESSTSFARRDRQDGRPWATKLPFPAMCVSRVEARDAISGSSRTERWRYRHGFYDHEEREFRGFGMVEHVDAERFDRFTGSSGAIADASLDQIPVRTRTWYHTGAFVRGQGILDRFAAEYFDNDALPEHRPGGDVESDVELTPDEMREAARACKGMILRQEIYADDESTAALVPYRTISHGQTIRMLQPQLGDASAVFLSLPAEAVTYHYERDVTAPRVAHEVNTVVDEIGNIVESASVVYGRAVPDMTLPADVRKEQARVRVAYTVRRYTNDVITDSAHRRRQVAETRRFELTGITPAVAHFTRSEIRNAFVAASSLQFEEPQHAGVAEKRLIRHDRVLFASDADPESPLAATVLQSLAIPYQSYRLAVTLSLRTALYGTRVGDAMLVEGGYVSDAEGRWWVPSGTRLYPANPEQHFYLPDQYVDPFGAATTIHYFGDSHLLIDRVDDALGNRTDVLEFDFRVLQPQSVRDLNDNIVDFRFDIAGVVVGRAERGKGMEADDLSGFDPDVPHAAITAFLADPEAHAASLLQHATARYVYDADTLPAVIATVTRETHHQASVASGTPSKLQLAFEYSDGFGRVAMRKIQAEPGVAATVTINLDGTYTIGEVDTTPDLRWVGSGRTIRNNKGNRVMEYEPYFSATHQYESNAELVERGVTPLLRYDPVDRVVRTDFPDGTFSRTEFGPWHRLVHDPNDNLLASGWYAARAGGAMGLFEQRAAQQTALHDGTPLSEHYDTLGQTIYTVSHNRFRDRTSGLIRDEIYDTRTELDIDGQRLSVRDPRGNDVMRYQYDLHGRAAVTSGMDGGTRRALTDVAGQQIYAWDAKGERFHTRFDALRRPTAREVLLGGGATLRYERLDYDADKLTNRNGQLVVHYDGSGIVTNDLFDFNGRVRETTRTFPADPASSPDWSNPAAVAMQPRTFPTSTAYDALGRVISTTTADGSVAAPQYSEASYLSAVGLSVRGAPAASVVLGILHDVRGQRTRIEHANGVITDTTYDDLTFRIRRIRSTRSSDGAVLQDLRYTYDPSGNVTSVRDLAQQTIYFNNAVVTPQCEFVYDALYRLVRATGREAIGLNAPASQFDRERTAIVHPADGSAVQSYLQQYEYDEAGNMTLMVHSSGSGPFINQWTRSFTIEASTNRLASSHVGPISESFAYDPHGNVASIGVVSAAEWDFRDRLRRASLDGGGTAHYTYDANGLRSRKVVVRLGALKEERLYLGNLEVFTRSLNGAVVLQRETLHVMDGPRRAALIETRVAGNDPGAAQLFRYVFSNHLGTATLELDEAAAIVSYEEYHPFGSTSFQTVAAGREVPAKRYRYSGKERDEETGLYDHGARYYAPWLARWTAPDPKGLEGGTNLYAFVLDNPIKFFDPDGRDVRLSVDQQTHTITYSTTVHVFATQADITRLTPLAQQAHTFFANPRIETDTQTWARFGSSRRGAAPPRQPVFTDASGTRWTVRFDVQYQFHDIATSPPPFTYQSFGTQQALSSFVTNRAANEQTMQQSFGYQPGDNVMTLSPVSGSVGGITSLMTSVDSTLPTFGRPESRMFAQVANNSSDSIVKISLIHETGHLLGFDERYLGAGPLSSTHKQFTFDLMAAADPGRTEVTMHPVHIEEAARFGIGVANGLNLTNQAIRASRIDATGTSGSIAAFDNAGAANTAYGPLQTLLRTEQIPVYRGTVTGTAPPPPPPPPPSLRGPHRVPPLP